MCSRFRESCGKCNTRRSSSCDHKRKVRFAVNIQGQSQKYGHLIVVGGTIIALIGFLFLPYVTMSSTAASSSSSPFSSLGITSLPFTMSAIQAASYQGFTWLEALLAAGILLIALLLAY